MAETRKVFPMQTFVSLLRGKSGSYNKDVLGLLSFITQKDVDEDFAPFAAALAKAWIYEQHPDLTRLKKEEVTDLGENVSVMQLPGDAMEEVNNIFDQLSGFKEKVAEQAEKLSECEATLNEDKKKISSLESKVKDYEAQMQKEGEKKIIASQEKVEDYLSKVDELLAKIDEVKKHGVVTVSGEGGAAAESGEASKEAPAEEEADFGFGFGGDPFGDSW